VVRALYRLRGRIDLWRQLDQCQLRGWGLKEIRKGPRGLPGQAQSSGMEQQRETQGTNEERGRMPTLGHSGPQGPTVAEIAFAHTEVITYLPPFGQGCRLPAVVGSACAHRRARTGALPLGEADTLASQADQRQRCADHTNTGH